MLHIASIKLEGPAIDMYLRFDKKDVAKVKKELLAEFEKGQLNREEAIQELANRSRAKGESAQTFAYKIELVKLAYPSIEDDTRGTIAKDHFVRSWVTREHADSFEIKRKIFVNRHQSFSNRS